MVRREALGLIGLSAGGLAASGTALAQEPKKKREERKERREARRAQQPRHAEHLRVIEECARVCNETAAHCLEIARQTGGDGAHMEEHIKAHEATMDCQAFCHMTSALMARGSAMSGFAHEACAKACAACAEACEFGTSEIMKECVRACRECEKVCREMAEAPRAARADRG